MSFWSSESSTKLAIGMPSRDKSHGTKLHKNEDLPRKPCFP